MNRIGSISDTGPAPDAQCLTCSVCDALCDGSVDDTRRVNAQDTDADAGFGFFREEIRDALPVYSDF